MSATILYIDDYAPGRYALTRTLREEGYSVIEAATGNDGLELARREAPDLILLDVNLPDVDGRDLCGIFKQESATAHVPVVMVSASFVEADDRVRGLEEGANVYFVDPVEPEVLLAQVRVLLRNSRAERKIELARREAEEANRRKDSMFAMLSHELRTPLTPVMAMLQHLREDLTLAPEMRSRMGLMHRNVESEVRLIDDLLDLTRIVNERLRLELRPVDAHALFEETVELFAGELEARRIRLRTELGASNRFVRADASRLRQVYWNLLRNALKFTPENGEIVARTSDDGESFRFDLSDSGIGIPPENLPNIFAAFQQGSPEIGIQYGGLGLGLAISRMIVDLHEGTIAAYSAGVDRGATFTMTLPTTTERPLAIFAEKKSSRTKADRAIHVLLVDDHADTATVFELVLAYRGYIVHRALGVRTALEVAKRNRFDILVSNLLLTDGNGYELLHAIREIQEIPAIAVSGCGLPQDLERSREAGFAVHLVKPVNVGELCSTIDSLVE